MALLQAHRETTLLLPVQHALNACLPIPRCAFAFETKPSFYWMPVMADGS